MEAETASPVVLNLISPPGKAQSLLQAWASFILTKQEEAFCPRHFIHLVYPLSCGQAPHRR